MLELFQELIEDGDKSILFSTHITSDLEKCADYITYINNGKIVISTTKDDMISSYRLIKGTKAQLDSTKPSLISYKENVFGFSGLIKKEHMANAHGCEIAEPNLEEIMIYYAKQEVKNEESIK